MSPPAGSLTPTQYEILEIVWDAGDSGVTVTEVWEAISRHRDVTRTTVLNLVDRLEKRRWLKRRKVKGNYRYSATLDREATSQMLASEVVDGFFGGSASELVMSLLGSKRLKAADVERLRQVLDSYSKHAE